MMNEVGSRAESRLMEEDKLINWKSVSAEKSAMQEVE
jgi:hypothetical protein